MKRNLEIAVALLLYASIGLMAMGIAGSALIPLLPLPRAEACGVAANRVAFVAECGVAVFGTMAWLSYGARTGNLGKYQLCKLNWVEAVLH